MQNGNSQLLELCSRENIDEAAKIMINLRSTEGKALKLYKERNYVQLLCLCDGLQHFLEQFYRFKQGKLTINWEKDRLVLKYNRALYHLKNGSAEETVQILMNSISYISGKLDEQKSSLGFMEPEDSFLINEQWLLMAQWQFQLSKFYYYLAVVSSRTNAKQIALVSVLKSLNLIQELYESKITQSKIKTNSQILSNEDLEIQDLLGICQIRQHLNHSKRLQELPEKTLLSVLNWLLYQPFTNVQNRQTSNFSVFGQVATLSLRGGDWNSSQEWQNEFINMKKTHCLNLHLLSQMQWTQQECYELTEEGSNKDMLLNSILVTYICKQYLAPSPAFNKILTQYTCQFGALTARKQTLTFKNLLKAFGMTTNDLQNHEPLTSSCFHHPRPNSSEDSLYEKTNKNTRQTLSKAKKRMPNTVKMMTSTGKVKHDKKCGTNKQIVVKKKERNHRQLNITIQQLQGQRGRSLGRRAHGSCKKKK